MKPNYARISHLGDWFKPLNNGMLHFSVNICRLAALPGPESTLLHKMLQVSISTSLSTVIAEKIYKSRLKVRPQPNVRRVKAYLYRISRIGLNYFSKVIRAFLWLLLKIPILRYNYFVP